MLNIRVQVPRFLTAGEAFFEKGSLGVLRALDAARIFVACSNSVLSDANHRARIERAIGKTPAKFVPVSGEPTLKTIQDLAQEMTRFQPDWIVAVGGGSVIDAAKIAWLFYEHPDLCIDRAMIPGGIPQLRGKAKLVAIPTTAGTGSEVSSSALFLDIETGIKRYLLTHQFLPDVVILDPNFLEGIPKKVLHTSGLDALAHSLEGLINPLSNPFIDIQGEASASVILRNIHRSMKSDDSIAKSEMMKAAMLAGWVQNAKIPGVGHAIAHQLGGFGIPHGAGVGLLLGDALKFNSVDSAVYAKLSLISERQGFKNLEGFLSHISDLPKSLELPDRLSAWVKTGSAKPNFESLASNALQDVCAKWNPRKLILQDVQVILESRW